MNWTQKNNARLFARCLGLYADLGGCQKEWAFIMMDSGAMSWGLLLCKPEFHGFDLLFAWLKGVFFRPYMSGTEGLVNTKTLGCEINFEGLKKQGYVEKIVNIIKWL